MKDASKALAEAIAASRYEDIPGGTIKEAHRALVNYVGCALGGADHPAVGITLEALGDFSGPAQAAVLGRDERVNISFAALLNGLSSHVHDFDDTTPSNYIHPSSPVASALFAYAAAHRVTGRDFLHAFVLGFDAVTRIGDATYPAHYSAGWHSTGSVGTFGAAAAIARLMGLDPERLLWALGLAATQASGLRDNFGSMAKGFHPGHAARCGLEAAYLARAGFTSGTTPIEGPRGFAAVTSAGQFDQETFAKGLGRDFRLEGNTYKPYPCGIVTHPTIEACSLLHHEGVDANEVEEVELRVAPLVRDLCDQRPINGLQGKFSIYHAAAIGLVRGRGGLEEFSDHAVADEAIAAMRGRVEAVADETVAEDAVKVIVRLRDGSQTTKELPSALGNLKRPLSNQQLERKFLDQVKVVSDQQANRILALCWQIGELEDIGDLVRSTVPSGQ